MTEESGLAEHQPIDLQVVYDALQAS